MQGKLGGSINNGDTLLLTNADTSAISSLQNGNIIRFFNATAAGSFTITNSRRHVGALRDDTSSAGTATNTTPTALQVDVHYQQF